jgi:hypothetical protein
MAADAADVLDLLEPVDLGDGLGDVTRAAELGRLRDLEHGIPVDGGIVLRRLLVAGCRHRPEIEQPARLASHFGGIDEAIATHPDAVSGFGKIGHDIAALIIGNDHSGEPGRQVGGLGNDPDTGFRTVRPRHHAADIIGIDGNCALGAHCARSGDHPPEDADRSKD